ncbi:MAG: type IV toxin-antitoxin system AbiEi family antitoxin domain-containing protein [Pseudonocardiaceae bacterium]
MHDLTDEIPTAVQVAVPRSHRPPRISYPPIKVFRFANATFELGLLMVEAAPGEDVRVYSAERTVVDLMRLRHRLGEPLALGALRRYLQRRDARPGELLSLARALDVMGPMRAAVDVASAEGAVQLGRLRAVWPTLTCRIGLGVSVAPPRSSSPSTPPPTEPSNGSAARSTPRS